MKWISDLVFKKAVSDAAARRETAAELGPLVEIQAENPILSAVIGGGIDRSG